MNRDAPSVGRLRGLLIWLPAFALLALGGCASPATSEPPSDDTDTDLMAPPTEDIYAPPAGGLSAADRPRVRDDLSSPPPMRGAGATPTVVDSGAASAGEDELEAMLASIRRDAAVRGPAPASAPAPSAGDRSVTTPTARDEGPDPAGWLEVFPGVRVHADAKLVEFEGTVPIDTRNEHAPIVYLEVIVCAPDSKEHEALVMAPIRASHLHAALLLVGLEPGRPTLWRVRDGRMEPAPATGAGVRVEVRAEGRAFENPASWIRNRQGGVSLAEAMPDGVWRFAGSRMTDRDGDGREEYDADGTGLLIGLHAFGSEVVAWARPMHPDSGVEEPEWIADAALTPRQGERVTVRLSPMEHSLE